MLCGLHASSTHFHAHTRTHSTLPRTPHFLPFPTALRTAMMEKEPAKAAALTLADVAFQKRQAAIVQGEAKYQALQQLIMEQLGVKPEELSTELPISLTAAAPAGEKKPTLNLHSLSSTTPAAAAAASAPASAPAGALSGAPSPSAKGGSSTSKAGASKPFSPSATQQQQGKKR